MSSNNKKKKRSPLLEALLHPGGEPASLHDHDTAKENPLLRALRLEIEAQQRKKRPRS